MRVMTAAVTTLALVAATISPARAESDADIEQLVRRHVQPALIAAGGMAVALNIDRRTLLFNYGMADAARKQPITPHALVHLPSLGKAAIATLLPHAGQRRGGVAHHP